MISSKIIINIRTKSKWLKKKTKKRYKSNQEDRLKEKVSVRPDVDLGSVFPHSSVSEYVIVSSLRQ